MISSLAKETINGAVRLVENIRYSNGKMVKRILDPITGIPTDIVDVTPTGLYKNQSGIALRIGSLIK